MLAHAIASSRSVMIASQSGQRFSVIEIASLNPQPRESHSSCVMPNIVRVGAGDDGIVGAPCSDTGDDPVEDPLLAGPQLIADAPRRRVALMLRPAFW